MEGNKLGNTYNTEYYNHKNIGVVRVMKISSFVSFMLLIICVLVQDIMSKGALNNFLVFSCMTLWLVMLLGCIFVYQEISAIKNNIRVSCDETKSKEERINSLLELKKSRQYIERIFFYAEDRNEAIIKIAKEAEALITKNIYALIFLVFLLVASAYILIDQGMKQLS